MAEFKRSCNPSKESSFFLFGARGTGKTSLIRKHLASDKIWTIDLLNNELEDRYARNPDHLYQQLAAQHTALDWVFIEKSRKCQAYSMSSIDRLNPLSLSRRSLP